MANRASKGLSLQGKLSRIQWRIPKGRIRFQYYAGSDHQSLPPSTVMPRFLAIPIR